MQSIPNTAVQLLQDRGSTVLCGAEVTEIIMEKGAAVGVQTKDGGEYFADRIISNASPSFTYDLLPSDYTQKPKMLGRIRNRKIFQSGCLLFMTLTDISSLQGNNAVFIGGSEHPFMDTSDFTPENCPLIVQILDKKPTDTYHPVVIMAPIPYEYQNCWNTNGTRVRGTEYYELKERVKGILLNRIYEKLGSAFKANVTWTDLGTPLTFERYTNSARGSFMGWAIDKANYGKFMKHKTAVPNLYLVGQWVFPGFGIAGVMASGYYLAKDLLKDDGVNLEKEFALAFEK
jgi:phytoene dehydrogenase-like protein